MSRYLLFLDESGDHGLKTIDRNFPIFVLTGLLFSEPDYNDACQKIDNLKRKYFGKARIVLHRRDMRKYEKGFEIFFDDKVKKSFYQDLNKILLEAKYTIVSSAINKQKHIAQYGKLADDPYEIALTFVIERTLFELDGRGDATEIHVNIEGRGKKEDAKLAKRYNELLFRGTGQVGSDRLVDLFGHELDVKLKADGICGIELADLCAYPIARYVLNNSEPNIAFDVIKSKIRSGPRGFSGYGIKIFPSK